jgi:hypothetical protein
MISQVRNVAHGWVRKECRGVFEAHWFVLFSNGILMYFDSPTRAMLGEARGFMPVDSCQYAQRDANCRAPIRASPAQPAPLCKDRLPPAQVR